jgi:hypothetical protein
MTEKQEIIFKGNSDKHRIKCPVEALGKTCPICEHSRKLKQASLEMKIRKLLAR